MSLEDVANVTITAGTRGITRKGFGTLGIAVHNFPAGLANLKTISYSEDSEMAADGWPAMHPGRLLANAVFNQPVKQLPVKLLNLRDTTTVTIIALQQWTTALLPEGKVFTITIKHADGSAPNVVSITMPASPTIAGFMTQLAAAITGLGIAGLSAAATTAPDECTISSTGGKFIHVDADMLGSFFLRHLDESLAAAGIGAELDAIQAHDPDWYGLISAHTSSAQIASIATWAEANGKHYLARTADTDVATNVSPNVAKAMVTADRARTNVVWNPVHSDPLAPGLHASELSKEPGMSHYVYKVIRGSAAPLPFMVTTANRGYLNADLVTYNVKEAGVIATRGGKVAAGEWIDNIHLIDFLKVRIAEDIYLAQLNNDKIAYTLAGTRAIVSVVEARLLAKVGKGLSEDEPPIVTAPTPQEVDVTDKINRVLPDVEFEATLSGAILTAKIRGKVVQ